MLVPFIAALSPEYKKKKKSPPGYQAFIVHLAQKQHVHEAMLQLALQLNCHRCKPNGVG